MINVKKAIYVHKTLNTPWSYLVLLVLIQIIWVFPTLPNVRFAQKASLVKKVQTPKLIHSKSVILGISAQKALNMPNSILVLEELIQDQESLFL